MKKLFFVALSAILLHGCASFQPSIPEGYNGPVASIQDTEKTIDSGKADLFYLSKIDGREIKNSRFESSMASNGNGDYLTTILLNNLVPVGEHTFTIVGSTEYAMPIRAMLGDVYHVEGDITFAPIQDEEYVIKGSLSESKSVVWIEKVSDGEVIGKIEKVETE